MQEPYADRRATDSAKKLGQILAVEVVRKSTQRDTPKRAGGIAESRARRSGLASSGKRSAPPVRSLGMILQLPSSGPGLPGSDPHDSYRGRPCVVTDLSD